MQSSSLKINRKIALIALIMLFVFGTIIARLYQLQITQVEMLYQLGQKNFTRIDKVDSPRGNILDTNGILLATNRPVTNLYWQGTNNYKLTDDQMRILNTLDTIIGTDLEMTTSKLTAVRLTERYGKKMLLASDISFDQLSKIAEQLPNCANIALSNHFMRHYPHNTLASHIVGYLGQINYDATGKMGLEKFLEDTLKGEQGEILRIINSLGKNLDVKELKQALVGNDIKTTIDFNLQQIAEALFPASCAGTLILMDPSSGALRALVSRPNFDPNIFLQSLDTQQWQELQENKAFLNRAFNACYPPASIFKLVTISAALEKKIIDPDSSIFCRGFYTFGNYHHWCMQHAGHGLLTIKQAVAKSCNILFFHIGKHISIDTLATYADRFGLGQKTNMLFPNSSGLIPTSKWKLMAKGERWWPGETLSAAIGQSFLLVTPIQIARMISSIFERYLVTPRLLEMEPIEKIPLAISKRTLDFLKDSMRSAVKSGTAIRISYLKDFEVYAKTGTAQTSSLALRNANNKYLEHAWFVAYFRYKNHKPLTLVLLIERAASSTVATGVARNFFIQYGKFLDKGEWDREVVTFDPNELV